MTQREQIQVDIYAERYYRKFRLLPDKELKRAAERSAQQYKFSVLARTHDVIFKYGKLCGARRACKERRMQIEDTVRS